MSETKCPNLLPPCWTAKGKWYDIEKRRYVDPPQKPVFVQIRGRKREAKRCIWLWKVVAEVQQFTEKEG